MSVLFSVNFWRAWRELTLDDVESSHVFGLLWDWACCNEGDKRGEHGGEDDELHVGNKLFGDCGVESGCELKLEETLSEGNRTSALFNKFCSGKWTGEMGVTRRCRYELVVVSNFRTENYLRL